MCAADVVCIDLLQASGNQQMILLRKDFNPFHFHERRVQKSPIDPLVSQRQKCIRIAKPHLWVPRQAAFASETT